MSAIETVVDALRSNVSVVKDLGGDRYQAQCPAHDDRDPSLSVRGIDGSVLLYCHAGCSTDDVLSAVGLTARDLYDERNGATYRYPDGRVVHRSPTKKFRQSGNTKGTALFHAERIGTAELVYVVEGEKDVLAVEAAGGTAVTSAMGAGKAHKFDWSPLHGRDVVLVVDKDAPGRGHVDDIRQVLRGNARSLRVVEAAVGKDAADHIAAGYQLHQFVPVGEDGAVLLDDLEAWYGRFISVSFEGDLALLALWTAHTHLVNELRTTPRLQIDSPMPNSGKTTVLDHFSRLCHRPIQIASPPSQALIPRLLEYEPRTILLDEVDRILRPDSPSTPDLLAITNSGYRVGATRPVLVPMKGGGWAASEMSTFCALALAGNAPVLPDDTRSRIIRVLLMPDLNGTVEDSDWEYVETDALALRERLAAFAVQVRDRVRGMAVDLPEGCIGRSKEKWRPLKRVAVAAGGRWPALADALIVRDVAQEAAEREAGLKTRPPGVVLLADLTEVWPGDESFAATRLLVSRLIDHNPDYWGAKSSYGKELTEQRFGRMLLQSANAMSCRPGGSASPRGYLRSQLELAWRRLGIPHQQTGQTGRTGRTGHEGREDDRSDRFCRSDRFGTDPPDEPAQCSRCGEPLLHPASVKRGFCEACHLTANKEGEKS